MATTTEEAKRSGAGVLVAFAVLVAATFAAFFLAAKLKSEPTVVHRLKRTRYFSPNGDGHNDVERIRFRVTKKERLTVDVIDEQEGRVRRIAPGVAVRPGRVVRMTWDGRSDDGPRAPDGLYRLRVILGHEGRAVVPPEAFHLDTRAPSPAVKVRPETALVAPGQPVKFSFNGLSRHQAAAVQVVRTDVEPARPVRHWQLANGAHHGTWDGRTDLGAPAEPGVYVVAVSGHDRAGNVGTGPRLPPREGTIEGRPGVTVRALAVQPPVRPVRTGDLVAFRIDARGQSYRWDVRRVGSPRPVKRNRRRNTDTTLAFRAPAGRSGVYLLEVRAGRWFTRVPFAVQAPAPARVLVVLPMISWLGRDPLDDPRSPDGVPNTFANGSLVPFPRPFAGGDRGLPAGFGDDLGPLLVFLDHARIRYDVTTDLALALDDEPIAQAHSGLLFAGHPGWTSRPLGRRLRRYVSDGGRVAIFGPQALRGAVTVGDGKLTRPTPAGPTDALGGRIAAVRKLTAPAGAAAPALSVLRDKPELGLLEGFSGQLTGFDEVEELISPGTRAELDAGLAEPLSEQEAADAEQSNKPPREVRAALSASALGKGEVIRVGLPQWGARLQAADPAVLQLTRNVVDLLRGVQPRVRST